MGDQKRGLYTKYRVERVDNKPIKGGFCLVLEVGDPNTWPAMHEYAETVRARGYEWLANDIERELAHQERGV